MFRITVQREFCAAHAIHIAGVQEPLHGHNWHVTVVVQRAQLDADGLVCDFHTLEASLDGILRPFNNNTLNQTPPFDSHNPTAEHIAKHIAQSLTPLLPEDVTIHSVSITEAPGCVATYLPD